MQQFSIHARQILMFGENRECDAAYKKILAKFLNGYRLTHEDYDQLAKLGERGPLILNRILSEYRKKVQYASK